MGKKPRKPTEPFGHINFGKDGSVSKHMFQLPSQKEEQETGAIQFFVEGIKDAQLGPHVYDIKKLPEADQDFLLNTSIGPVIVQLTELVEREFTNELSLDEYNSGRYNHFILKQSGQIPWAVNTELRDSALIRVIEKKITKNYSKSDKEILWLVIFTTSLHFMTEYSEGGKLKKSKALLLAQEYLRALPKCIFDQVWFTNLQTRPVRVWP